jgi:hypothetical protein
MGCSRTSNKPCGCGSCSGTASSERSGGGSTTGRSGSIGSRLSAAWGARASLAARASTRARRPPSIGSRPSAPESTPFSLAVDPTDAVRDVIAMLDFFFPTGTSGRAEAFQLLMTLEPWQRERAMAAIGRVAPGARLDALKGYLAKPEPPPVEPPAPPSPPISAPQYVSIIAGGRGRMVPLIPGSAPPLKPTPTPTCIVNGFDPRWGTPPADWKSVALQFDATTGAYRFDLRWALLHSPQDAFGHPLYSAFDFQKVKDNYGWQLWLQPYRTNVSSPWEFRWIPAVATSQVQCF